MTGARIMLIDDHPIVREGYRRLIERHPNYRVVGEGGDAAEAYRLYRELEPDIVIMDIALPGPGGIEATRRIRQCDGTARILIFTMHQGAAFALKAFQAGASGYVTKSSEPAELVRAIEAVLGGRRAISPDVARELAEDRLSNAVTAVAELTPREVEILRMIARGSTTETIAASLAISLKTAQNNHYQIKSKVGARTDAELVWLAIEAGLVQVETTSSSDRS